MRTPTRFVGADGPAPPHRFDVFDLVVFATTSAWSVASLVSTRLSDLDDMARGHANWRRDRRELCDDVDDTLRRLP